MGEGEKMPINLNNIDDVFGSNSSRKMTDFYLFRKVVISRQLLFCEMAFFHLYLANMSFSSEKNCVHQ